MTLVFEPTCVTLFLRSVHLDYHMEGQTGFRSHSVSSPLRFLLRFCSAKTEPYRDENLTFSFSMLFHNSLQTETELD